MEESLIKNLSKMTIEEKPAEIGGRLEDFEVLQVLGKGAYGFVAKVKSKLNLKIYALKKYESSHLKNEDMLKYCVNESIFMQNLNHPNVLKLHKVFYQNEDLYMIMEYMDGGDLYTFINAHIQLNSRLNEEKLCIIYEQCLKGLVYLHKKGLIHRDIKPANLLLNSLGEVKYSDFNVSAIINLDKARDFTRDKSEEENLINNMTQVGSGSYAAPEINDDSVYSEYDLKIDVYSLGITFCTLAFFKMEPPKDDNEKNSTGYSRQLIDIICDMVEKDAALRKSAQEIYDEFIKFYVEKYVYSTGFISVLMSLFASPSIKNLFFNYNNFGKDSPVTEKIKEIFMQVFQNSGKKSVNHLIYELRKILIDTGMNIKDRGNNEIEPIVIINFLIKKLNEELNIYKGQLGKLMAIYGKGIKSENPKRDAYENYMKFYNSNFRSFISEDFFGLIKTKDICQNCNTYTYSFKVLCYIPFNVKVLLESQENNNKNLDLYDAFTCLNQNYIVLDKKQFVKCKNCGCVTEHKEFKQFYNLSKNLVIVFDRGENYEYNNFINFDDNFKLNFNYIENFYNLSVNYYLISVICRIEEQDPRNNRIQNKFIPFIRQQDNAFFCPLTEQQNRTYNLNEIKKIGVVVALFYYSDMGIPNFSEKQNIENSILEKKNSNNCINNNQININLDMNNQNMNMNINNQNMNNQNINMVNQNVNNNNNINMNMNNQNMNNQNININNQNINMNNQNMNNQNMNNQNINNQNINMNNQNMNNQNININNQNMNINNQNSSMNNQNMNMNNNNNMNINMNNQNMNMINNNNMNINMNNQNMNMNNNNNININNSNFNNNNQNMNINMNVLNNIRANRGQNNNSNSSMSISHPNMNFQHNINVNSNINFSNRNNMNVNSSINRQINGNNQNNMNNNRYGFNNFTNNQFNPNFNNFQSNNNNINNINNQMNIQSNNRMNNQMNQNNMNNQMNQNNMNNQMNNGMNNQMNINNMANNMPFNMNNNTNNLGNRQNNNNNSFIANQLNQINNINNNFNSNRNIQGNNFSVIQQNQINNQNNFNNNINQNNMNRFNPNQNNNNQNNNNFNNNNNAFS